MNTIMKAGVILAAATRMTLLVTKDEITSPVRYIVDDWAEGKPVGSFPERMQYLINCHRCSSVWLAAVALALSTSGPGMAVLSTLATSQVVLTVIEAMEEK